MASWTRRSGSFSKWSASVLQTQELARQHFNVVYWSELPRGGHFAAEEQPEIWIRDVRNFFFVGLRAAGSRPLTGTLPRETRLSVLGRSRVPGASWRSATLEGERSRRSCRSRPARRSRSKTFGRR